MESNEMQSLVEIKKDVAEDIKLDIVDENYCVDLYDKGNLISGYALWLAKEVVHKGKQTGWKKFCNRIGVSLAMADFSINFYEAKSPTIVGDSPDALPDIESQFRALPSGTREEKIEAYAEVKEILHKDTPTAAEIILVKKVKARATQYREKEAEELETKAFEILNKATPAIKKAFIKAPNNFALKKFIMATEKGEMEQVRLDILTGENREKLPKVPDTCKGIRDQNTIFRGKMKELEIEVKELRAYKNENDYVAEFTKAMRFMAIKIAAVENEKMLKSVAFDNMKPALKRALQFMEFDIHDLSGITKDTLKKRYREMAKTLHPDKKLTGSNDLFLELKAANDKIHNLLEGDK